MSINGKHSTTKIPYGWFETSMALLSNLGLLYGIPIGLFCIFIIFIPVSNVKKKSILTLVKGGWNLSNNQDRYRHVYIFLIRKKNENFMQKCLSVRTQNLCTLKLENDKDNWMRFFLIESCIPGIEIPKFSTRTHKGFVSRIKFFTTFLYLRIRLMKPIQLFLIIKL